MSPDPARVAVSFERPDTPFALEVSVKLSVPLSEPSVDELAPTARLLVVAPLALAAKPVNPVTDTPALSDEPDTSSLSWKLAFEIAALPIATFCDDTVAPW